ncbi:MAG: hypothetical protein OXU64_03030 [Gemmatimonadota bacterium]|nr:hypothetical protein [Deltaproteobacteria bacterium]MDE2973687.1 hypothetical protein [Gemmatimonadota bacterium]
MKTYIAWGLISVLLVPLFVGSVAAFLPTVDPVAKAQRIIMMSNQITQITHSVSQLATLTEQLTELKAQYQHLKDASMGQVQALTQPFTQLASQGTGLVSDAMSWKSEFTGTPGDVATAIAEMGQSGTSLTTTWRGWIQQADTVQEADVVALHDGQPSELKDRVVESWKKRREREDKQLVLDLAAADAAAELATALREALAAIEDLRQQTNVSDTALAQAQLSGSLTRGNLGVAQAQVQAHKAAKEAAKKMEDQRYLRDKISDWTDAQTNAKTALQARLTAIEADRDAMRQRTLLGVHSFYGRSFGEQTPTAPTGGTPTTGP